MIETIFPTPLPSPSLIKWQPSEYRGITPGKSTYKDVIKRFGKPKGDSNPEGWEEVENPIPKQAGINIKLTSAPGINNEKSTWEMGWELRIIDGDTLFDLAKSGELMKDGSDVKHGELIAKSSFKKSDLSQMKNRETNLQIPFDEKTIEKLKIELQNSFPNQNSPDNKTNAKTRPAEIKLQVFLFYANALIYDAKLKKSVIVPFDWIMPFSRHPNAKFEMTIDINPDGSYGKRIILPQKSTNTITIPAKQ